MSWASRRFFYGKLFNLLRADSKLFETYSAFLLIAWSAGFYVFIPYDEATVYGRADDHLTPLLTMFVLLPIGILGIAVRHLVYSSVNTLSHEST